MCSVRSCVAWSIGMAGVLGSVGLGGCLVGGSSETRVTGAYIGPQTVAAVRPGETRAEGVVAMFGEPSNKSTLEDGSELWRWDYTRSSKGGGYVFLIAASRHRDEVSSRTFVQLKEGVVTKVWQDSSAPASPPVDD